MAGTNPPDDLQQSDPSKSINHWIYSSYYYKFFLMLTAYSKHRRSLKQPLGDITIHSTNVLSSQQASLNLLSKRYEEELMKYKV